LGQPSDAVGLSFPGECWKERENRAVDTKEKELLLIHCWHGSPFLLQIKEKGR